MQFFELLWHILSESKKPHPAKETPTPEPTVGSSLPALHTSTTEMWFRSVEPCNLFLKRTIFFIALEIKRSWYMKIKVLHASKDNRSLLQYKGFQHMWMPILSEHISIVISHPKWLNFPLIHLICIINEYTKKQCTLLIKHWLGSQETGFVSQPFNSV